MDNPEKLATQCTQYEEKPNKNSLILVFSNLNVREYRRGNQNGQSRENGNTGHTIRRKTNKKIHNHFNVFK